MKLLGLGIKGFQKTSLIDYPGKISSVIFLEGCNYRCPYCHNPELVLRTDKNKEIDPDELIAFLKTQKKWIDGICMTGGEPTLNPLLPDFINKLKKEGFLINLHTNGTNPKMIRQLIKDKLIDYVAMDIKGTKEKYPQITGVRIDLSLIQDSIDLIRKSGIDYEFRTTAVPAFFTEDDALKIAKWLKGSKTFYIQQFGSSHATLDPLFQNTGTYDLNQLEGFKKIMEPYFEKIEIRGS